MQKLKSGTLLIVQEDHETEHYWHNCLTSSFGFLWHQISDKIPSRNWTDSIRGGGAVDNLSA